MKKFQNWLATRFLPLCARASFQEEIHRLKQENEGFQRKIREQNAYIAGLEMGMRSLRKIQIYTGEGRA